MTRTFAIAIALLVAIPAHAATIYSKTLWYGGTCNAQDQVPAMYEPWEPVPINIVGVEVAVFQGTLDYLLTGNSYSPDIMMAMGKGMTRGVTFFPPGLAFPFPAATGQPDPHTHIDAHVSCPTGGAYQFFQVIYYTK
jgi:hypothetical protein